ncbi:hypothetical protein [Mycoplasma capricolum]|uniref:Uncharacterized protein n=1 Tax=Mycoplasma capricolum subsp. capripneumoniae 87001 TaxID=1124992 RepID=A0A9N7AXW9_MYCCC|nr:hypothetical protein [Mycoplasma capricolum]AJK51344.1 hypothetical protein MCCG_0370 [Mycoplasma capricolum subsp. capripneumoniae 87001]AOQ22036.1 hypothetical protein M1601_01650 [Mycoplasma capricolum subsp. capripneumoniae M1601]AQU77435.1 hypothetical protein BVA24_01650 [Mycoplasma capricolum subsp. capripneumoniae]QIN42288.1 hypothetical protein FOY62_01635 [Mycoplasma capricolum subsp. capripneumoniae]QIN42982.1 hypothetical protein FOY63_01630 [Mycoplasma capricolum subsp. capripn
MRTKAVFPQRLRKVKFYIWKSLSLPDIVYLMLCVGIGFILYTSLTIIKHWNYRFTISIFVPIFLVIFIIPTNFNKPEIRIYHQIKWLISFLVTPKKFKKLNKKNNKLKENKNQNVFKIVSNKSNKVNNQVKELKQEQSFEQELKELKNLISQQLKNKRKEK